MASYARGFRGGLPIWTVDHDSSRGTFDLRVGGSPPAAFDKLHYSSIARQMGAGGEKADVDHLIDVPVELTRSLTSFRHDEGEFAFEALQRPS